MNSSKSARECRNIFPRKWKCVVVSMIVQLHESFYDKILPVFIWLNRKLLELLRGVSTSYKSEGYYVLRAGGEMSNKRLADKLSIKLNLASRLYEQRMLKSIQRLENSHNNSMFYVQRIGLCVPSLPQAITEPLGQLDRA